MRVVVLEVQVLEVDKSIMPSNEKMKIEGIKWKIEGK